MAKKVKHQKVGNNAPTNYQVSSAKIIDIVFMCSDAEKAQSLVDSYGNLNTDQQSKLRVFVFGCNSELNLNSNCFQFENSSVTGVLDVIGQRNSQKAVVIEGEKLTKKLELQDFAKLDVADNAVTSIFYVGQEGKDKPSSASYTVANTSVQQYAVEILPKNTELSEITSFVARKLNLSANRVELRKNAPNEPVSRNSVANKIKRWFWWYLMFVQSPAAQMPGVFVCWVQGSISTRP